MNALHLADEVIIPMCEYLALEGLGVMVDLVSQVVASHRGLHISGILMTMYNPSTNLSRQVVQED